MNAAGDALAYLEAVMTLHRALAAAARVPVLDAMHQTVVAVLRATLARATFIDGYQPLLRHSIGVHEGLVEAIASRNRVAFSKVMLLHNDDLIRTGDPRRSPGQVMPPAGLRGADRGLDAGDQLGAGGRRGRASRTG
jgi:DNA-binding GntR family transcriptional regulator